MKIEKQTLIVFAVFFLLRSFSVSAQEIYRLTVSQNGEADYTSIRQVEDAGKAFPGISTQIKIKNTERRR